MGRTTRWLRGLLGMKKEKGSSNFSKEFEGKVKEKKRWSFEKTRRDSSSPSPPPLSQIPPTDGSWLRNYIAENEEEQSKRAIVVAAATAAAADAAVAAAKAAVAVVRLTSLGRGGVFCGGGETSAAVKIQAVFRGYLARKALRALRGLVKLQAYVRGYLVRRQAARALHGMQALHRAQAAVRSQRARRSMTKGSSRLYSEYWHQKLIELFDETRRECSSKRGSASGDPLRYNACDESPKVVEIDTYKTRSRSRRSSQASMSDYGEDLLYPAISSPLPCPIPARLSIPERSRTLNEHEWGLYSGGKCRSFTAHSTPRLTKTLKASSPITPTKSDCGDSFYRPYICRDNSPNYMANTKSSWAKLRLQSAPRQRPESLETRKRILLHEILAARNIISNARVH